MNKQFLIRGLLGLFVGLLSLGAAAQATSVYTSIAPKDCKTLKKDERGSEQLCQGVGGYQLVVMNGDHPDVAVVGADKKRHFLDVPNFATWADFPSNKVEWRLDKTQNNGVPYALIFRVKAAGVDGAKGKVSLLVTKLGKTNVCITHQIANDKNANEQAQQTADKLSQSKCLKLQ